MFDLSKLCWDIKIKYHLTEHKTNLAQFTIHTKTQLFQKPIAETIYKWFYWKQAADLRQRTIF